MGLFTFPDKVQLILTVFLTGFVTRNVKCRLISLLSYTIDHIGLVIKSVSADLQDAL